MFETRGWWASAMLCCSLVAGAAQASGNFPTRTIQVVVPYAAGGAVDVIGRIVLEQAAKQLGQSIVVLNRPGANANIGPSIAAQAAPDGYTLLASSSATVINPVVDSKIGWSRDSFVPIARVGQSASLVVVPASSGHTSFAEFIAHAKANPGLTTPVTGFGSSQAVARESFARVTGIELLDVAYKGGVSFIPDLLAGTLAVSVSPINVVTRLVKDGKLVALANTGERRSSLLPDVPTMAELGYPEATSVSWFGFHAPAGTPPAVVARLSAALRAAVEEPEVKARITALGAETAYLDTLDFERFLAKELERAEVFVASLKPGR
ncbi:MAG: Bug family tripartite tricarboxylate transporter substrate binding protein [Lautropia sp.]